MICRKETEILRCKIPSDLDLTYFFVKIKLILTIIIIKVNWLIGYLYTCLDKSNKPLENPITLLSSELQKSEMLRCSKSL